jgi:hypothetical protein
MTIASNLRAKIIDSEKNTFFLLPDIELYSDACSPKIFLNGEELIIPPTPRAAVAVKKSRLVCTVHCIFLS